MEIRLDGRSAIVTGGSRGLGFATAMRVAECGADVAILARRPDVLEQSRKALAAKARGKVAAFACDVAKDAEIKTAFDGVMKAFGKVDIVVNNAGESKVTAFEGLSDEMLQRDLDLKLFAAVRLIRLAWPQMKERRWGRVINVLNIGAKAPRGGSAPTVISRAAGMALTKVLSHEGAPHNILVNALLVGRIVSDQVDVITSRRKDGASRDQVIAEIGRDEVPLGRMGEAGEFANVAAFFASDAGSYLSGVALNVDGAKSPVM